MAIPRNQTVPLVVRQKREEAPSTTLKTAVAAPTARPIAANADSVKRGPG